MEPFGISYGTTFSMSIASILVTNEHGRSKTMLITKTYSAPNVQLLI